MQDSNSNSKREPEHIKYCPHGTRQETIDSHLKNWRTWREAIESGNSTEVSAPCKVCFITLQREYYKAEFTRLKNDVDKLTAQNFALLEANNSYRTMMYDTTNGATKLSIHYLEVSTKGIDSMSMDECLEQYNLHVGHMELYAQGMQRKNNQIDLKKASEEFKASRKRKQEAELNANAAIPPKVKIPVESKPKAAPKTAEEKMLAGIMKTYKCDEAKAREIAAPLLKLKE